MLKKTTKQAKNQPPYLAERNKVLVGGGVRVEKGENENLESLIISEVFSWISLIGRDLGP